jgi:LuxR family transcriptional regulator, maltose regulon positive regulatory protein
MATQAVPRLVAGLVSRPRLFELLERGAQGPVTLISAPAGSGKTMLLASWLRSAEPAGPVAWVVVGRDETDATRFWGLVMDELRDSGAIAADDPLTTLAPAPHGGEEEFVQRLLDGLGRLSTTVLLILDDLQELRSEDALRGLERLLERVPPNLRVFLVSRRDPELGLHRLRLSGELTELRSADLDFTGEETGELLAGAGVAVSAGDVARLHERTEGWAAGLRLAAMSLARHEAPDRFVAEFSGSERAVADYLLGEVLASRPPEVRQLLLRTCILERVNGPLADLLTGRTDGARLLHDLEEANALVVAADVGRSWFRYHQLLSDLLRLELRREAADEVPGLHRLAAGWFAVNGHPTGAIRHALLGEDWELAAELLGRHWVDLVLAGEDATLHSLLSGLPPGLADSDAEIATIAAADRLTEARWGEADALLESAAGAVGDLPDARRHRAETALATVRLLRARRLGGLETVVDSAGAALGAGGIPAGAELEALALMNLAIAESWTLRLHDAEAHFQQSLAAGRTLGSPYIEFGCLTGLGVVANLSHRLDVAETLLREAIAIAERLGWGGHQMAAAAYVTLGAVLVERGMLDDGESWLGRAAPIVTRTPEPAVSVGLHHAHGLLAFADGRYEEALSAFREGERATAELRAPHFLAVVERQWQLRVQVRLGELDAVRAGLDEARAGPAGALAEWDNLEARVRLAVSDPAGAAEALAPLLAGEVSAYHPAFEIEALLLDAVARAEIGEVEAAERSIERALELAEPQGRVLMFLAVPGVEDLVERHPIHRTAHAAHLRVLLDQFAGRQPGWGAEPADELPEPLSDRELAVLRFLPTNLSATEIGGELFLSVHTVKTHMRKLYAKLDVHTRTDAVQRGRALGLLAPARRSG